MGVTLVHSDRTNTPEDPTDLVELARQVQKVRKLCRSTDGWCFNLSKMSSYFTSWFWSLLSVLWWLKRPILGRQRDVHRLGRQSFGFVLLLYLWCFLIGALIYWPCTGQVHVGLLLHLKRNIKTSVNLNEFASFTLPVHNLMTWIWSIFFSKVPFIVGIQGWKWIEWSECSFLLPCVCCVLELS